MTKAMQTLLDSRPWIQHIDDERNLDNGIIVTLRNGWEFNDDPTCGTRGFDNMTEVKSGTKKSEVNQHTIYL